MANITKGYKRFMMVSCSHGILSDPNALEATLRFKAAYKPHTRGHLGDFIDTTAFRTGASGTKDESASVADDLSHGLNFLREYGPTILLNGNHENRLWEKAHHPNALVARAAASVIVEIQELAEKLKCRYLQTYDIDESWVMLGDAALIHGWMWGQNALRDHIEHFAFKKLIMGHTHAAEEKPGRRSDRPYGFSTGLLADRKKLTYAHQRRATSAWSHGIVFGEYNDHECHPNLTRSECGQASSWRFPI